MADKHTMTERERDIATQIRDACKVICGDVDKINEAKDAASALGENVTKTKLSVMVQVAQLSSAGKWLPGEIVHATKYAASLTNNPDDKRTEKSLATFLSEMNAVAHPKVRDRFPVILQALEDAWSVEEQEMTLPAADRAPMPIRKWASRKYHAITGLARAVKDGKADIHSANDVMQYAIENDPDHNPERIAKRLESLAETLQGIYVDFGNDDIGRAYNYINTITVESLIESRKAKLAAQAKAEREARALKPQTTATASKPSQPKVIVAQETNPVAHATNEPAEGASDILGEILNDPPPARIMVEQHITELAA